MSSSRERPSSDADASESPAESRLPMPSFAPLADAARHAQEAQETRFQLFDFLLLFGFQVTFSALVYGLYTMAVPSPSKEQKQLWTLLVSVWTGCGVIVLWLWLGRKQHRMTWKAMGWQGFSWKALLLWSGIFFPLVMGFTYLHAKLLSLLKFSNPTQDVASFFSPLQPLWFQSLAFFLIVVVAPVSEEMMYRGLLFRSLQRTYPLVVAAFWSGLIFGMIHIQPNTIIPLAFLGFLLARCLAATGSLWMPILLHSFNNLIAFLLLKWS